MYTDDTLDALRQVADPEVDALIKEVAEDVSTEDANVLLRRLLDNGHELPDDLPPAITAWLEETDDVPSDIDYERLDRASAFFKEYGIPITLILSTASLIGCYAAQRGAKVLTFTYRLGQTPYRRIAETGQFVLIVMTPGALKPGGAGIPAIQKIRLMHASIRYLIGRTGRWKNDEYGVPINQEDMLGTMMVFSYGTIWGLKRIGNPLSEQEAEDYFYSWRVIAEMLGIQRKHIPTNVAEAEALAFKIAERQHGPSPEGKYLTKALLEMHSGLIPGTFFDDGVPAFVRYMVEDEMADWFDIPTTRWDRLTKHIPKVSKLLDSVDDRAGIIADLADRVGMALLEREAVRATNYKRGKLHIPTEFRQDWDLS